MKRSEPLQIGAIIEQMLARSSADPAVRNSYICSLWHQVAGPNISAYTSQVRLEKRIMHVYITSAVLKEDLGYMRAVMTRQINSLAGEDVIDNILIH